MMVKFRAARRWIEWLEGLAAHCRVTNSTAIEQALLRYAEGVGYHAPPPRRLDLPRRQPTTARTVAREIRSHHDDHQAEDVARVREQLLAEGRDDEPQRVGFIAHGGNLAGDLAGDGHQVEPR